MKHKNDLILREDVLREVAEWISSGENRACMSNFFLTDRIKGIEKRGELNEDDGTTFEIKRETSEPYDRIRITTSGFYVAFDVPKTL